MRRPSGLETAQVMAPGGALCSAVTRYFWLYKYVLVHSRWVSPLDIDLSLPKTPPATWKKAYTTTSSLQPPPKLSDKYSGITERLLDKATVLKRQVVELSTSEIVPRSSNIELRVIPSGYSRPRFNRPIESLRSLIGPENVELNDKPLDNGW